jgi:hypothetical protein
MNLSRNIINLPIKPIKRAYPPLLKNMMIKLNRAKMHLNSFRAQLSNMKIFKMSMVKLMMLLMKLFKSKLKIILKNSAIQLNFVLIWAKPQEIGMTL